MSHGARVWRAPLIGRIFLALLAAFCLLGVALPWDDGFTTIPPDGSGDYEDVGYRLLLIALAAVSLAWTRGRVELRDGSLIMRYMLTTRVIPLASVVSVTPTESGLTVETSEGAQHGSPAFIGEKSPLATWMRRRTRADEITEAIMRARPQG